MNYNRNLTWGGSGQENDTVLKKHNSHLHRRKDLNMEKENKYTREQIIDALLDNDKEINFTKPPKPRKKSKNKQ